MCQNLLRLDQYINSEKRTRFSETCITGPQIVSDWQRWPDVNVLDLQFREEPCLGWRMILVECSPAQGPRRGPGARRKGPQMRPRARSPASYLTPRHGQGTRIELAATTGNMSAQTLRYMLRVNGASRVTEMLSFWWNFRHWLHWMMSKGQLPVQPVIKISSKWRHFCVNVVWISLYFSLFDLFDSSPQHILCNLNHGT